MKRLQWILFGFFCGLTLWSNSRIGLQADPGSEAVLGKLRSRVSSYGSYRIHLTATTEREGGTVEKGTITISGVKFTAKMMGQELYYDGTTLWNYIPAEGEVTIEQVNSLQGGSVLANPAKLLHVDPNDYHHRSLPAVKDDKTGRELQVVELVPKTKITDYTSLVLYVDRATTLPVRITVNAPSVEKPIELTVIRIENDFPVTMEDFRFDTDKYTGVEVIDFR